MISNLKIFGLIKNIAKNTDSSLRLLVEEKGKKITKETIAFIKFVEDQAYPDEMKLMQEDKTIKDIADTYDVGVSQITIARNKDWYIIYAENDDYIEICDIASLPNRDVDASRQEIHDYIVGVLNVKAHNSHKSVILCAKEDTSYKMIQRMVRNGEYEIIEDISTTWDSTSAIKMHDLVLKPKIKGGSSSKK